MDENDGQMNQGNDEKDLAILLESLRSYETIDPQTRREVFDIIRSLLTQNEKTKNYFRELQGVQLMIAIYQHFNKLKDSEFVNHALYTLGVATEQNDASREALMTPEYFAMMKGGLKSSLVPSAFLLLCLTSNHVPGQNLSRSSHCINKLCCELKAKLALDKETEETRLACNALCTTLCAMVSNPVNGANQDICCRLLLPTLVRSLYLDLHPKTLRAVISLIGCCSIDNNESQKYLCVVGGIRALAAVLLKSQADLHACVESQFGRKFIISLVNTLSCSYTNCATNKIQGIELDVIKGLLGCLKLFSDLNKDIDIQVACVSALLNLLDGDASVFDKGKQKFQDSGGIATMIELLTTENERLKKLVTIVLHKTFDKEAISPNRSRSTKTILEGDCECPINGSAAISPMATHNITEDEVPSSISGSTTTHPQTTESSCGSPVSNCIDMPLISERQDSMQDKIQRINTSDKQLQLPTKRICGYPVNGCVEIPLIDTNFNRKRSDETLASYGNFQCKCKTIPYIDSHNVLQILNSNMVCSHHNSLGHVISGYLKKKKS